jgi:hypothetical protein
MFMGFDQRDLGRMIYLFRLQTEKIFSEHDLQSNADEGHFQVYFHHVKGIAVKTPMRPSFGEDFSSSESLSRVRIPEELEILKKDKYYKKYKKRFFESLEEKAKELIFSHHNEDLYDEYSVELKKLVKDLSLTNDYKREKVFEAYLRDYKAFKSISKKEARYRKKLGFKKKIV